MPKVARFLAATTLAFGSLLFSQPGYASCVQPYQTVEPTEGITTIETCGGDDTSYQIPITTTISFDGQEYTTVYATTNSVITFGRPDNTYWDYPLTPSISLYSMDWVAYPTWRSDEHLVIQTSDGGFQVDISARPYWYQSAITPTNIIITAAINADGTVAISYVTAGPTYDQQTRTGVRLTSGDVVTLEAYGIIQVEEVVELTPEPVQPSPTPTTEPITEPTPEPPAPAPQPIERPIEQPAPTPEPIPEQTIEPTPEPSITPPEPATSPDPVIEPVIPEPTPEAVIEPPVEPVLTEAEVISQLAEEARADDPQLPTELASIPLLGNVASAVLDAFNALGNVGADMTQEVRATAQKATVASVIVGQIATTASLSMGASYRRNK